MPVERHERCKQQPPTLHVFVQENIREYQQVIKLHSYPNNFKGLLVNIHVYNHINHTEKYIVKEKIVLLKYLLISSSYRNGIFYVQSKDKRKSACSLLYYCSYAVLLHPLQVESKHFNQYFLYC